MTKHPKKEVVKLLDNLYKQSFQNGVDYCTDAKTLAEENQSYGHAIGLLVLAEEEFAKAFFLWICYGMFKNDLWYLSEEDEALSISKIISDHKTKHELAAYLKKYTFILMTQEGLPDPRELSPSELKQVVDNITNELLGETTPEKQKILNQIEKEYEPLQRIREHGTYVDIDKDKFKVKGPHNITERQFVKQYYYTGFTMLACHHSINQQLDKKMALKLKEAYSIDGK